MSRGAKAEVGYPLSSVRECSTGADTSHCITCAVSFTYLDNDILGSFDLAANAWYTRLLFITNSSLVVSAAWWVRLWVVHFFDGDKGRSVLDNWSFGCRWLTWAHQFHWRLLGHGSWSSVKNLLRDRCSILLVGHKISSVITGHETAGPVLDCLSRVLVARHYLPHINLYLAKLSSLLVHRSHTTNSLKCC